MVTTRTAPPLPVVALVVSATLLGLVITMGELNRLIETAHGLGRTADFSSVLVPTPWHDQRAWLVWSESGYGRAVQWWILAHTMAGLTVAGIVVGALWNLLPVISRPVRRAALTFVAVKVLETLIVGVHALLLGGGSASPVLMGSGELIATAKWLSIVALSTAVVLTPGVVRLTQQWVLRAARALWVQRLSAVLVLLLGGLGLVPARDILDQLPDVQRQWFESWAGLGHASAATIGTIFVAFVLFTHGRFRSELAVQPYSTRASTYRPWLVFPAALLVLAAVVQITLGSDFVEWATVAIVVTVPLVVVALSVAVRRSSPRSVGQKAAVSQRDAYDIWIAGDVLAVALLLIAWLGLIRSLTAPVALLLSGLIPGTGALPFIVGLCIAWALALCTPLICAALIRRAVVTGEPPTGVAVTRLLDPRCHSPAPGWLLAFIVGVPIALLALAALLPLDVPPLLGVIGTTIVTLGSWVLLISFLTVHFQRHAPLPVFTALRLRETPFLTIVVIALVMTAYSTTTSDLHRVSSDAARAVDEPLTLSQLWDQWLETSSDCDRIVPIPDGGTVSVRPMLLVAASGGGIRAAEWSAGVISAFGDHGCGSSAVLLSSGVSGGSVGLALTHTHGGASSDDPLALTSTISRSDALAVALGGLASRDFVAGATGIRVPLIGDNSTWRDRAALMSETWSTQEPALSGTSNTGHVMGPGGALIFNATDARTGCRAVLSQVELPAPNIGGMVPASCGPAGLTDSEHGALAQSAPSMIDLATRLGTCMPDQSWASAALVSARFPWITPTAQFRGPHNDTCSGETFQLGDGGYSDPSGIATLVEIAPPLASRVLQHNIAVLANAADNEVPNTLIIPIVVHLDDSPVAEFTTLDSRPTSEVLAPLVLLQGAGTVQNTTTTWMNRAAYSYGVTCPTGIAQCDAAVEHVVGFLGANMVTIAPDTRPTLRSPLGWTLSELSRSSTRAALHENADSGTLGSLKALLDGEDD
ncbi:hypothetical protein IEU95_07540 [Hoyosella rhizosphaerae]|nr:hypothetical protein [Hoyosella rhizosphaerae]MBN4926677.1 hypothetical protein [Hoyosella rhizosphaerae]